MSTTASRRSSSSSAASSAKRSASPSSGRKNLSIASLASSLGNDAAKATEMVLTSGPRLFLGLCTPAQIYAVACIIVTLFNLVTKPSLYSFTLNVLFSFVFIWLLKYMCDRGHTQFPWFMAGLSVIATMFIVLVDQTSKATA
jgi:hypothetical protein